MRPAFVSSKRPTYVVSPEPGATQRPPKPTKRNMWNHIRGVVAVTPRDKPQFRDVAPTLHVRRTLRTAPGSRAYGSAPGSRAYPSAPGTRGYPSAPGSRAYPAAHVLRFYHQPLGLGPAPQFVTPVPNPRPLPLTSP